MARQAWLARIIPPEPSVPFLFLFRGEVERSARRRHRADDAERRMHLLGPLFTGLWMPLSLLRGDPQVREVSARAVFNPALTILPRGSVRAPTGQRWHRRDVHEGAYRLTLDNDPGAEPAVRIGHGRDRALVLPRMLFPQPSPGVVRVRDVLHGPAPAWLGGAEVERPEVDRVEGRVVRAPERDTDEALARAADPQFRLVRQHDHEVAAGILAQLVDKVDIDDRGPMDADESAAAERAVPSRLASAFTPSSRCLAASRSLPELPELAG